MYAYTRVYARVCVQYYSPKRQTRLRNSISTKNLIYLYNVYKTRNIIRVGQHAQIGESPAIIREKRYHMIPDKSFVHKVRTPFPSMRPTKRFVAISRDATGSGTLCSANNNRNRIVPWSSITDAMRKRTCAYWIIEVAGQRIRSYALTFCSLKNILFLYLR